MKEYKVTFRDKSYKVTALDEKDAATKLMNKLKDTEVDTMKAYKVSYRDKSYKVKAEDAKAAAKKFSKSKYFKDSNKLKELAYKLAQMGNYFDRANSMFSRDILAREDSAKLSEFYNLAVQTYTQLKYEIEQIKKVVNEPVDKLWGRDSDTAKLLQDAVSRLYWTHDPKCKAMANKLEPLVKEFIKYTK